MKSFTSVLLIAISGCWLSTQELISYHKASDGILSMLQRNMHNMENFQQARSNGMHHEATNDRLEKTPKHFVNLASENLHSIFPSVGKFSTAEGPHDIFVEPTESSYKIPFKKYFYLTDFSEADSVDPNAFSNNASKFHTKGKHESSLIRNKLALKRDVSINQDLDLLAKMLLRQDLISKQRNSEYLRLIGKRE